MFFWGVGGGKECHPEGRKHELYRKLREACRQKIRAYKPSTGADRPDRTGHHHPLL